MSGAVEGVASNWPMSIFQEDLLEQARRLSVAPLLNETPGSWRDRVRCMALTSDRHDVIEADSAVLSAGWGGDPYSFASELRRIANSWGEGYRLPSTLRDAADEIERLATLASLTTPPARSYADGVEDAAKVALKHAVILDLAQGHEDAEGQADRWYDGGKHSGHVIAAAIRLLSQGEKA